jgi:class 3 adenylate cyclase
VVPEPRAIEAERRSVTVLFADLCGFTKLSQSIDPEDLHQLLGRYFEVLDGAVTRAGGTVDKHIGDAVMAIFGAPVAHSDDPERAVHAATEIHEAMLGLSAEVSRPLAVHVGIAAGEVMASGLGSSAHSAYTVIGQSVNLAARLVQFAGSGETIVDDGVRTAVGRDARFAAIDDVQLKGVDGRIRLWRLLRGPEMPLSLAVSMGPFVGRERELAQLRSALAACRLQQSGTTIYIRGEPGIGKTRLLEELRRIAVEEGFSHHTGLVLDFGTGQGRDAVHTICQGLLGLDPGSSPEHRAEVHADAVASPWCNEIGSAIIADLINIPLPPAAKSLYEAMDDAARQKARSDTFVALLAAACSERPRLLIVEDLHWADAATLAFAMAATRAVAKLPAVLVVTSRIDGDPLTPSWRASVHGAPFLTMDLGPLTEAESRALACTHLAAPSGLVDKCIARAEGNPLFLEQLLRNTEEDEDRLPTSVQSLVLARIDRLPEYDRYVPPPSSGSAFPFGSFVS